MENIAGTDHLSRPQAIERIRGALLARKEEAECACGVAARMGIFCHGFRELSDAQFRKRFEWIAVKRPKASRAELEQLVSLYHLGRQEARAAALCCDVETREHCACDGWNRFDNEALEKFCLELTGRPVQIG
ncbi:MAG: hypothetical protein M3542_04255 [Acidobacteriota bacterium]|nr:hypothetical protein [Acidobacteriota bacterium]MDQ5871193.1 hypothetical protein [Acidobacteriota bacterium]